MDATLGSYCLTEPDPPRGFVRECGDVPPPLRLSGRVPTHPRDRIVLEHQAEAQSVLVAASDERGRAVSAAVAASPVDAERHRWVYELPADVPSTADRISVFVRYPNGDDTNWEAGVALHRHGEDPRRHIRVTAGGGRVHPVLTRSCLRTRPSVPLHCRRTRRSSRSIAVARLISGGTLRLVTPTAATGVRVVFMQRAAEGETIMEPITVRGRPDQGAKSWTVAIPTRLPRSGTLRVRIGYSEEEFAGFENPFRTRQRR